MAGPETDDARESDDAAMAAISADLIDAVDAALESWATSAVARFRGDLGAEATAAAHRCRAEVVGELRELLTLDVDAQPTTPLVVLRGAARYPTAVLAGAGVPPVIRDPFDVRMDPDDVYGIAPATWRDLGPDVAEAGLRWGAAKAFIHRARHR